MKNCCRASLRRKRAEDALRRSSKLLIGKKTENSGIEQINRAFVGRGMRVVELKKEVNELSSHVADLVRHQLEFEENQ